MFGTSPTVPLTGSDLIPSTFCFEDDGWLTHFLVGEISLSFCSTYFFPTYFVSLFGKNI
jgi:hypothetical protein